MDSDPDSAVVARIAALQAELGAKKTFVAACRALAELSEDGEAMSPRAIEGMANAGKRAFTVLQARFSSPKFWQAGLEFFLQLEFHFPSIASAVQWREAAMLEVDEDARQAAQAQAVRLRQEEDRKHSQGRFSDAAMPISMGELMAAQGLVLVEDSRPGMSRNARDELRLVTVVSEETCAVCQEALPVGSKAKAMPCKHLFHDDCLIQWVEKNNSCPMCRYDELPSEKIHFDDVERRIITNGPSTTGLYA